MAKIKTEIDISFYVPDQVTEHGRSPIEYPGVKIYPLGDLSDTDLRKLCEEFTQAVLNKALMQREPVPISRVAPGNE